MTLGFLVRDGGASLSKAIVDSILSQIRLSQISEEPLLITVEMPGSLLIDK